MKKTLVSALTTALVVGAASTTFAAANPFEDVPADHWAYDAVAQLAADGVIEGYGDGTYRGDQEITRYEMAQMIARAMAKNPNGADKALVDKLAAEFADELNNLGVRVAALEKKVDNVKWGGKIRYRYIKRTVEGGSNGNAPGKEANPHGTSRNENGNVNGLLLRFEPQMKINEHWTGKARIDYNNNNEMKDAENYSSVSVDRIYVQGDYKNLKILLGKLPYKTQADYGLIMDRYFTGGSVTFGSDVKVALNAGRINSTSSNSALVNFGALNERTLADTTWSEGTVSYGGIEVYNDRAKKFTWGLGYHHVKQDSMEQVIGKKQYSIWAVGLGYKFNDDLSLTGAYSKANGVKNDNLAGIQYDSKQKYSYSIELAYKGADPKKVNSWGAFIGYRHLGAFSSTGWNTYHLNGPQNSGERGFEIGLSWAPMKSVTGIVRYFSGKEMKSPFHADERKVHAIFTEWNFLF